jgi:hypothetical protein
MVDKMGNGSRHVYGRSGCRNNLHDEAFQMRGIPPWQKKPKQGKAIWLQLPTWKKKAAASIKASPKSPTKRKPLKPRSKKRILQSQIYREKRLAFLCAYPRCAAYIARSGGWELMRMHPSPENALRLVLLIELAPPATTIHHTRGRAGPLYLDETFWLGVSLENHQWIDANNDAARALGLLCRRGLYNVPA